MNDEETQRMADLTRKLADTAIDYKQRAEVLEELIMDVVADLRSGVKDSEIDYRIGKVMQRLDAND
jgi:hypothetical protein